MLSYILPPILGAIIALSTNWLAIVMLFRPHEEKRIFGIKIPFTPGLVPKEQARLAKKLSEAISTSLLTPEMLAAELTGLSEPGLAALKDLAEKSLPNAASAIDTFLENHPEIDQKLAALIYKIVDENVSRFAGMFISKEKVYTSLKTSLKEYLSNPENGAVEAVSAFLSNEQNTTHRVLTIFAEYLAENMPIQAMIESKIASFDVAEAEKLILQVVGRELRLIVVLGGVFGFFMGLLAVLV